MNNFFEQFKKEFQNSRLTPREKSVIRARLMQEMRLRPAVGRTPSPYAFFSFSFVQRTLVPLSVVLVLLVGTGTAFAAQGSLPGDLLYPIKIGVNENVQTALARTPQARAQVHADLAERRLEEAEILASQGRLDAHTTGELQSNLDLHTSEADKLAGDIEAEDPGASAQISAELDSSFSAHGAILARLGHDSVDKPTKDNSDDLATHVLARGETVKSKRKAEAATTARFAAGSQPEAPSAQVSSAEPQQVVAAQLAKKALSVLAKTQEQFDSFKGSLDAATAAQVQSQLASTSVLMSKGSTALGAEAYGEAVRYFSQALKGAVELGAFLKAGKDFDHDIISPLIQDNSRDSSHGEDK